MYTDVGQVAMENTPFAGINICPSHLFPQALLKAVDNLYAVAKYKGHAIDSFGEKWSVKQAVKLYYYVYKRCQSTKSHSEFYGFSNDLEKLKKRTLFNDKNNFTFRDDCSDIDFQKILKFVKKHEGTVDCSKILQACRWGPKGKQKCSEIFELVQTETGNCCSLKSISNPNSSYKSEQHRWNIDDHAFVGNLVNRANNDMRDSPSFQKVAGSEFGLSFVLVMETEDMACPMNDISAYMIYVQSPLDGPNVKSNGIPVAPGHEVDINVNADITLFDKEILNLEVESRQCYSQEEGLKLLNSTKHYTEGNCRAECRELLFQSRCNCHPFITTNGMNKSMCGPQDAQCEDKLEADLQTLGYSQMCRNLSKPMTCYHGCTEVVYKTVASSTPYFKKPALLYELDIKPGQYASIVRIFFGSDSFEARLRQQQYDFWEYVGLVGGLLGMLIGFDFMTLVHLTYAFGIWMKGLWLKRKKSRVAQAIFNMTNHVDLVKALSTQTPVTPGPVGPSTGTCIQPRTWPREMAKLEGRLKSIYAIQKKTENEHIPLEDSIYLDEPANLIDPVEIVPTRKTIRNALFEHMPRKVAFQNIFKIPKRVAPADLIDHIELLDIEPAEPSDMEIVDPNVIEPVAQADPTEFLFVDPTDMEPADPIEIDTVEPTDLELTESATMEFVDPELIEPTDIASNEQTELIDPGAMQPIAQFDLEPVTPADRIEPLEPSDTNLVNPAEAQNRIPLYKHKEYLENGQVIIVLNPKKPLPHPKENISSSEDEL